MEEDLGAPTPAFNVQLRDLDPAGLRASWLGLHAAALWGWLKAVHRAGGAVEQVEWGTYEGELAGSDARLLLAVALEGWGEDWRSQPVECLEVGPPGCRERLVGVPGRAPPSSLDLEALASMIDDQHRYIMTAEIF
jgi:hypothetical protein